MAGIVDTKPRAISEFHGPNSRFPLTEGHKGVACEKCHPGNVFKQNTPLQCGPSCHPDELHKGTLGKDCLNCHTGGKWEARLFDHDTKTKWPLVGNHKDVLCEGCHARRDFANNRGKQNTCYNCHKKDDAHAGAARHALRELPLARRHGELRPQRSGRQRLAARGQARQGQVRRLPSVDPLQADAARVRRLPRRARRASRAARHVVRVVPRGRRLEDRPHRPRRADAALRRGARPRAVRVVPPGRATARRHGQLVHHVPSQRRHPPQRARAATAASAIRSGRGRGRTSSTRASAASSSACIACCRAWTATSAATSRRWRRTASAATPRTARAHPQRRTRFRTPTSPPARIATTPSSSGPTRRGSSRNRADVSRCADEAAPPCARRAGGATRAVAGARPGSEGSLQHQAHRARDVRSGAGRLDPGRVWARGAGFVAVRARLRRAAGGDRRPAAPRQLRSAPRRARPHHRTVLDGRGDAGRRSDRRPRLSRRPRVRGAAGVGAPPRRKRRLRPRPHGRRRS